MKKVLLSLLVLGSLLQNTYSQQETDLRELFLAAESYYLFEEFNEALPLYLRIHRQFPDNDNINFKIGVCFLNNPYEKNKSIIYLEKAVENINPKYKDNNFKETGAPLESLFYLGNAYRVNDQLAKARNYYNLFLSRLDPEVYDTDLVKEQLAACDAADRLMKMPIDYDVTNLSDKINTRFADMNPVVSGDETKMAFISKLQFYDAVFYSEKVNGEWTPPRNIVPELGVDGDVYPTSLSYNGTEMFVYRNDDYIGNLYTTRLVNGKWTPLQKLGENINTKYWESHASISKDGKTLYFSSNRKGGYGGLDIYRSKRMPDGKWGPPKNLGPVINTKYNDDTPFISDQDDKIYFSSYGHYSMGGYDIFVSKRISDTVWAKPLNLGYPINTTDDDQFFVPIQNGAVAYYSRYTEQGYGRNDIFRYVVYSPDNPRLFNIKGLVDFMGETGNPEEINISVVSKSSKDTLAEVSPDFDGNFSFKVPSGNYNVIFDSDKFKKHILSLDVLPNTPHEGFTLSSPIALELAPPIISHKDISGYLSLREDSIMHVKDNDPVKIRFNAEPGTVAEIEVKNNSKIIYTDTLLVDRKRQSFEFTPETGENIVTITLKDSEGNITSQTMTVVSAGKDEKGSIKEVIGSETKTVGASSDSRKDAAESGLSEAEKLKEELIRNSSGELKKFLENLDTKANNLKTEEDLINYLYKSAERNQFTVKDINNALNKAGRLSDIEMAKIDLASQTENQALKDFLLNTDTDALGLKTKDELLKYLYDNAEAGGYSISDVDELVKNNLNQKEVERIIASLANNAEGNLKEYLKNLDPAKEGITDLNSLIDHLLKNTDKNGYTEADVLNALAKMGSENTYVSKESLIKQLKSDELLKMLLSDLSDEQLKAMTENEIIKYLFEQASQKDIAEDELIKRILTTTNPDPQKLIEGLKHTASKELKDFLNGKTNFPSTSVEIFEELMKDAENQNFDSGDVREAFRKYLENKDLIDYLNAMKKHADGDLLKVLNSVNLEKEQISNRADLINYLRKMSETHDFTMADVARLSAAAENNLYMENLLDKLISIAEGGLKQALIDLKLNNPGITNLQELITYLIENQDKYGYTSADIYMLVMDYYEGSEPGARMPAEKEKPELQNKFRKGALMTGLILGLEGFIILILIILARRKKKKE